MKSKETKGLSKKLKQKEFHDEKSSQQGLIKL